MRSVLVAAMMARMSVAGGAGSGVEAEAQYVQPGSSWQDVRKHFSALRSELSTLEDEYQAALERRRREMQQQHQEIELARRGK